MKKDSNSRRRGTKSSAGLTSAKPSAPALKGVNEFQEYPKAAQLNDISVTDPTSTPESYYVDWEAVAGLVADLILASLPDEISGTSGISDDSNASKSKTTNSRFLKKKSRG